MSAWRDGTKQVSFADGSSSPARQIRPPIVAVIHRVMSGVIVFLSLRRREL